MFLAFQEQQREHVLELTTIELDGSRPIKVVQGDALLETGLEQVALKGLLRMFASTARGCATRQRNASATCILR